MRTLGIDYGTKRIGVAWTDPSGSIPLPLDTHENHGVVEFIDYVRDLQKEEVLETIVVGRPLNMQGKATEFTSEVDDFVSHLQKALSIPVVTVDERLTSKSALAIHDASAKEKRDVRAAQLILETYLAQK